MKSFLAAAVIVASALVLRAQSPSPRMYLGGAWATTSERGTVVTVDPTNECNTFSNGTGSGFAGSAGIDWRLATALRIGGSVVVQTDNASFVTRQSNALVRDAQNNLVPFVRDYTMSVNLARIAAVGTVAVQPFSFPLEIGAGLGPDLRIASQAARTGAVVSPANVQFAGHRSTEDLGSAALPGLRRVGALATASLAYTLPMSRVMHLIPEVRSTYEIPAIASGGSWTPFSWTFGVRLAADLQPEPEEAALEPVVVTTIITTTPGANVSGDIPPSTVTLAAYNINDAGTNERVARIVCERVPARVTAITAAGERTIDTAIIVPRPRSIAFVLTGPAQPAFSTWSVRVIRQRDTLFTHSADAAPPAAIVWREEEIRNAIEGDEGMVSATAVTRDGSGAQSVAMIPVVIEAARDTARVHRYVVSSQMLMAQWSALMSRFASEAGRSGSITMFSATPNGLRHARLQIPSTKAHDNTLRDAFERRIAEFGDTIIIEFSR